MADFFNVNKLFDICYYIFSFFILNLLFMLLNIPIILFFLFVGISSIFAYFPLFLCCLLPTFPSFNILVYCMNKLFKNKGFNLMADFKKGLVLNFKQSLFIWSVELIFIFILYSNIKFFTLAYNNTVLSCIFIGIILIILLMTPFISLLISLFSNSSLNIVKNALILTFTRPMLTITNILLPLVCLVLFEVSPGTTFLFIASLLAFLFTFANRSLIQELELVSNN